MRAFRAPASRQLLSVMKFDHILKKWRARWKGGDSAAEGGREIPETQQVGLWGEQVAAMSLCDGGYKILGKRVRMRRDEIDIVAACDVGGGVEMIVFVEVKTRRADWFGGGKAALDKRKRHALCRAAAKYMQRLPKKPFRFDLIEVVGDMGSGAPPVVRHFKNAFPMELRYVPNGLHKKNF